VIVPADQGVPEQRRPETEYDRLVWRAMLIAKDVDACCALIRGEPVPPERIDWKQAGRFARRR